MTLERISTIGARRGATVFALFVAFGLCLCVSPGVPGTGPARSAAAAENISPRPLLPAGVSDRVDRTIEKGLKFLASVQAKDGCFGASRWDPSHYPTVMSAMVGMTFLASGSTPTRGPYARNIQRITDYLLTNCRTRGGLLTNSQAWEERPMYGHAFATTYLALVYGQEGDPGRRARIHAVLTEAVTLLAEVQSDHGGWGYEADFSSDEGTLTVTQTQALRTCRDAGILVPKGVIDRAVGYIRASTNTSGSLRGAVRYRTTSEYSRTRPGVTCAAVVTLLNAGRYDDPLLPLITTYIEQSILPGWEQNWSYSWNRVHHAEYVLYYLAQAKYFGGGREWERFYRRASDQIIAGQEPDGSWRGKDVRLVGEVYSTAIALLALQLPYNRLPTFQR